MKEKTCFQLEPWFFVSGEPLRHYSEGRDHTPRAHQRRVVGTLAELCNTPLRVTRGVTFLDPRCALESTRLRRLVDGIEAAPRPYRGCRGVGQCDDDKVCSV